ncbi:MAG: glycosyltransferase involved in cell wall biosynthesis [Polaribacter sp.]|jgi:glycosyltransferase involved in cell wall biosynthesis
MTSLVSIITPNYNSEKIIEQTLQSIIKQTFITGSY